MRTIVLGSVQICSLFIVVSTKFEFSLPSLSSLLDLDRITPNISALVEAAPRFSISAALSSSSVPFASMYVDDFRSVCDLGDDTPVRPSDGPATRFRQRRFVGGADTNDGDVPDGSAPSLSSSLPSSCSRFWTLSMIVVFSWMRCDSVCCAPKWL